MILESYRKLSRGQIDCCVRLCMTVFVEPRGHALKIQYGLIKFTDQPVGHVGTLVDSTLSPRLLGLVVSHRLV